MNACIYRLANAWMNSNIRSVDMRMVIIGLPSPWPRKRTMCCTNTKYEDHGLLPLVRLQMNPAGGKGVSNEVVGIY